MQPSQYDIQREVEVLRDLRRRSTSQGGPGALLLDPDLPNSSPQSSPYWNSGGTPTTSITEEDASNSSNEGGSSSDHTVHAAPDDPFHLFWVPANLHPEIAPAEFRAFLKEHARNPATDGTTTPERSNSISSTSSSLERRRSMLSRQYRPSENDDGTEEKVIPMRRRSVYSNPVPQLTISDLQKLEVLAEQESESEDISKLRHILRRSLSLNISPSGSLSYYSM